jgi:hypothetical protein
VVTFICRTCGAEHELSFGQPDGYFWCDEACHERFTRVVEHLVKNGEPAEVVDCGSRLFREAVREVHALRRREVIERRELTAREVERERPRPMRALYPC